MLSLHEAFLHIWRTARIDVAAAAILMAVTAPCPPARAADSFPGRNASADAAKATPPASPWADWIERGFPFFSALIYAQQDNDPLLNRNRTPRGIVLNLGDGVWAGFDLDLLRLAAVWQGEEEKTYSSAAYSYHGAWPSSRERSKRPPLSAGAIWLANGLYPGWQLGTQPRLIDPRPPVPDPDEIGRGPLPESHGRFRALRLTRAGVQLEYGVADALITEQISRSSGRRRIERCIRVSSTEQTLVLVLAAKPAVAAGEAPSRATADLEILTGDPRRAALIEHDDVLALRLSPHSGDIVLRIGLDCEPGLPLPSTAEMRHGSAASLPDLEAPPARWPEVLTTRAVLSRDGGAYVVDDIPLPLENPWRRNVRVSDVQFLPDGAAALVTYDGDVWIARGLSGDLDNVRWRRFTSGLHEPLSMAVRDRELFVFDRNGIWRLRDTDANGEADVHELFSNAFEQTFTINEYSNTMKLAPDGSFIIAKKSAHRELDGPANGTVMRLSPDGRRTTVLGWGFRQPFIGVDPLTGVITASDQEGNYVPATPLYLVRGGTYHGFLQPAQAKETHPAPIDEPLTWLPRTASASGVTQVWLRHARMGPLNDSLIYASYNPAELSVVRLNERSSRLQAAVVSLTRDFDFSPIGATVNPADGQLYVAGFKIYGSAAKRVSGLARVRYTGGPSVLPREIVPTREGVLLHFEVELARDAATDPGRYSIERWNYRRSAAYGSPHYKLDGARGQDRMDPASAYLSRDRKSVFVGLPGMRSDVMQMQLRWSLAAADGRRFENTAHFTPFVLTDFDPVAEGFGELKVDLTPRITAPAASDLPSSAAEGERLYQTIGCAACHTTTGAAQLGPTWRGLFASRRAFADGSTTTADEAYLRESILEPMARVVPGFDAPMPSYAGILNEAQIESLILYIKTLH